MLICYLTVLAALIQRNYIKVSNVYFNRDFFN